MTKTVARKRCEELKNDDYREDRRCMRCRLGLDVDIATKTVHGNADLMYQGIDTSLTGKPIQVNGKDHFKRLLKEHHAVEYSSNRRGIKPLKKGFDRKTEVAIEKAIGESIHQVKQKYGSIPRPTSITQMRREAEQFRKERLHHAAYQNAR